MTVTKIIVIQLESLLGIFLILISHNFMKINASLTELPADKQGKLELLHSRVQTTPGLSSIQEQQILDDIQHHRKINFANTKLESIIFPSQLKFNSESDAFTTSLPTFTEYNTNRSNKLQGQSKRSFLPAPQTQYDLTSRYDSPTLLMNYNSAFQTNSPLQILRNSLEKLQYQSEQALNLQLQSYLKKQQELELLNKRKEELLLEQKELERQQELLKLQRFRELSTLKKPITDSTSVNKNVIRTPVVQQPGSCEITSAESGIFLKAIATHQKKFVSSTSISPLTLSTKTQLSEEKKIRKRLQNNPDELISLVQERNLNIPEKDQLNQGMEIKHQTEKSASDFLNKKVRFDDNESTEQLAYVQTGNNVDINNKSVITRNLVLPNGRKLQVLQALKSLSILIPNEKFSQFQTVMDEDNTSYTSTTIKPINYDLAELTKELLPDEVNFEVLKQRGDGKLEKVSNSSIQNQAGKKIMFIVVEEQPDGRYKVQNIRGNAEKEIHTDIDSILNKIKIGELKFPVSSEKSNRKLIDTKSKTVHESSTTIRTSYTQPPSMEPANILSIFERYPKAEKNEENRNVSSTPVNIAGTSASSSLKHVTPATSILTSVDNIHKSSFGNNSALSFHPIASYQLESLTTQTKSRSTPSVTPALRIKSTTELSPILSSFEPHSSTLVYSYQNPITLNNSTPVNVRTPAIQEISNSSSKNQSLDNMSRKNAFFHFDKETIADFLKQSNLFAMAKYLHQSGLDNVLNETGPYTIFVPTDKAFKSLLIQLGGPERAGQKFRENPRLLSGLLLHHIIPGVFELNSLQDEMTGVSLAGTQLRVNLYAMHDHEWNDVKITTINGARIILNKGDISIPQGIAHTIDRVMFPLPIGDLIQTLASDREQRFGTFLKILQFSGLDETLTGMKTFTIFAPTDAVFATTEIEQGRAIWTESDGQEAAKAIISKYIIPSTLYSAGMRYYHQKDTLHPNFVLQIQKNGGRVRVNNARIITYNIPATNGVVHSIDALL